MSVPVTFLHENTSSTLERSYHGLGGHRTA